MKINKLHKIVGVVIITALLVAGAMYMWHLSVVRSIHQKQKDIDAKYEKAIQALNLKDVTIKGLKVRIGRGTGEFSRRRAERFIENLYI